MYTRKFTAELCAQVGFGVASLPPQLVVLKKVTMKSWAAEQQLTAGRKKWMLNSLVNDIQYCIQK
jgi:hypothetical protein